MVVLSARHDAMQKVRALDLGANDYVTKPFNADELLARMRVATRKADAGPDRRVVQTASFSIDLSRRVVMRERERLLDSLRVPSVPHSSHYLRVYVQQLRAKLEPVPASPRHLVTVAGVGYRLDP